MESKGRLIIIAIAGVLVAFVAIGVYNRVVGGNDAPLVEKTPQENNRVLVARHDLSPGMFVQTPMDVDWQQVEPGLIQEEHIREGSVQLTSFNGAVVRRQLRAGDMVPSSALMTSGEGGFMSAVLEPGMRAISVAVNATSGNAGFISPGDRVDLIVTRRIRMGNDEQIVSETFVHDVRVLAVDQMLDNPENKAILAKTVTVEVTSGQAEQVSVAGEMGKISLALRSVVAPQRAAQTQPAANTDESEPVDLFMSEETVTQGHDLDDQRPISKRIRVIRGEVVENLELH